MIFGRYQTVFEEKRLIDITKLAFGSFVYFLHQGDEVVYVGQSKRLGTRLINHRSDKTFDRVSAIVVPEYRLYEVESAFIRVLKPQYNKTQPTSRPYAEDAEIVAEFGIIVQSSNALSIGEAPPEHYGPVAIISGEYAGHIGYYDDDDYEPDENIDCYCKEEECDCYAGCKEQAVVYLETINDGPMLFDFDEVRPLLNPPEGWSKAMFEKFQLPE